MKKLILVTVMATALAACATDDPNKRTKTGAAIGAAAGAIVGYAVDDGAGGVLAGAAVGTLAGAGVGRYMDNQQKEMNAALADEQARNELQIQQLQDESLKIDIANEVSFDVDSAAIKPGFEATLNKVADVLQRFPKTVVHVIGHTDSSGSESYNQQLSERRAQSVSSYFASRGVLTERLKPTGRGELQPRATNDTAAGRQLNRRVEIIVKPIVEGQESEAYQTPQNSY